MQREVFGKTQGVGVQLVAQLTASSGSSGVWHPVAPQGCRAAIISLAVPPTVSIFLLIRLYQYCTGSGSTACYHRMPSNLLHKQAQHQHCSRTTMQPQHQITGTCPAGCGPRTAKRALSHVQLCEAGDNCWHGKSCWHC
jgi:hypothetical protein